MFVILVDGEILYHPLLVSDGYAITSGTVEKEIDKAGSAQFVVPDTNPSYRLCKKMKSMIQILRDDIELFRGRILHDERDFDNNRSIYCEGELAFMIDHILSPYNTAIIRQLWSTQFQQDYGRGFNGNVGDYFRYFVSVYNSQVESYKKFTVGSVTVADANVVEDISNVEYPTIWDDINDKLINAHGGHIRIRYVTSKSGESPLEMSFVMGYLTDRGVYGGSDKRIATQDYVDVRHFGRIRYSVMSGYKLEYHFYSNRSESSWISGNFWLTGEGEIPIAGPFMRVSYASADDGVALDTTDSNKITLYCTVGTSTLNESFAMGFITDKGVWGGSDKRIATKQFIDVSDFTEVHFSVADGYMLEYHFYADQSEDSWISGRFWMTGTGSIAVLGKYMRLSYASVGDETALSPSDSNKVTITYKKSIRYIDYIEDYNKFADQDIALGSNLLDVTEEISAEDIVTCLIPLGKIPDGSKERINIKSVNGDKLYVEDADAIAQYGRIWKTQVWDEETDPGKLKALGEKFLQGNKTQTRTLTISAVDLSLIDPTITGFDIGDNVRLYSMAHGLNQYIRCQKVSIDLLNPDSTTYTFGSVSKTMSEQSSSTSSSASSANNAAARSAADAGDGYSRAVEYTNNRLYTATNAFESDRSGFSNEQLMDDTLLGLVDAVAPKMYKTATGKSRFKLGLAAQDLNAVMDDLSITDKPILSGTVVDYDELLVVLWREVQRLRERVTALEGE